ncbi:MAG TPA: hypothetical protein QGF58_01110 [Myxococcota bacterium]|nr:hypothetical protein [Myxococcota bacterium]
MKRFVFISLALGATVACVPAPLDVSFDADGAVDLNLGEDPDEQISEWEFYDGGGWHKADGCQDELTATGNEVGDVTADAEFSDQFGDAVRLYDFCDRAVLLVSGAFW